MDDTQLTLHEVRGPFEDLFRKLSGEDGREWLMALNKFLRKENPWLKPGFQIWKTIEVGTHGSPESLSNAISSAGMGCTGDGYHNLWRIPLSNLPLTLSLVRPSVEELGFPEGATLEEIYKSAQNQGLELCPAEVGPYLRMQYKKQPRKEYLNMAMEPLPGYEGDAQGPRVFTIVHNHPSFDKGKLLHAEHGFRPEYTRESNERFVFIRRE